MSWETYTTALKRGLPALSEAHPDRNGAHLTLQCKDGHTKTEHVDKRMPAEAVKKLLTNRGWRLWGKKAWCPEHNTKTEKEEETEVEVPSNVVEMAAKTPAPVDGSQRAKVAKREAMLWLGEVFDEAKGRYKDGHSDETVAKETNLSPAAIEKLREEFGFEIREPTEFAQWRLELTALENNIGAVKEGVEEKIEKLRADAEDTVKALLHQSAQLRQKIEQTIRERGW